MTRRRIRYFPVLPDPGELGAERADFVRDWIKNFLRRSEVVTSQSKSNVILGASGDGGFMKTVKNFYPLEKPFFGINCGTMGFLLNPISEINKLPLYLDQLETVKVHPMKATFYSVDGEVHKHLSFNDVYIGAGVEDFIKFEIEGSKSGFINRTGNRAPMGTGVFVTTPQGSTGYALNALGSSAVTPLSSNIWRIGGIATGPYPNDVCVPQEIRITVHSRFPVNAFADTRTEKMENVKTIVLEPTDISFELAYMPGFDFEARRADLAQQRERGEI